MVRVVVDYFNLSVDVKTAIGSFSCILVDCEDSGNVKGTRHVEWYLIYGETFEGPV